MSAFDQHLSYKYFLKIAFVRKISPKLSDGFGCYRHELVKDINLEADRGFFISLYPGVYGCHWFQE